MKKHLLALALATSFSYTQHACPMIQDVALVDSPQSLVVSHPGIGPCDFMYDGTTFSVIQDDQAYEVQPAFLDKKLRGISSHKLLAFLDQGGYLYVNQLDNGEFTITAQGRLKGGLLGFVIFAISVGQLIINASSSISASPVIVSNNTGHRRVDNVGPVRAGDPSRIGSSERMPRRPDGPHQNWTPRPKDPPPTSRMPDRLDNTGTPRQPMNGPDRPGRTPMPETPPMDNTTS